MAAKVIGTAKVLDVKAFVAQAALAPAAGINASQGQNSEIVTLRISSGDQGTFDSILKMQIKTTASQGFFDPQKNYSLTFTEL